MNFSNDACGFIKRSKNLKKSNGGYVTKNKAHISKLNLLAEVQAIQYKYKPTKTVQDTLENSSRHWRQWMIKLNPVVLLTTSKNLENNASRTGGSGSPFKCIDLVVEGYVMEENRGCRGWKRMTAASVGGG
uniref:Uncharacterized protein n=1 Tax=Tanacetum cinerariifolium TaxID=118510 RepID=A0A6L2M2K4_TANCI|nr:hypothetical protein [Tanacetum cinerariifolium]